MKYVILLISILLASLLHAEMPVIDVGAAKLLLDQFRQGTQQLQQIQQQVETANNLYNTAQYALKYQGNPAAVLGGIKDASLGGALNPSNISASFDKLLGTLHSASNISSQLQGLVGIPVSVDGIRNQLLAGQTPSSNLAKYQAMEQLFDQQNRQLQTASQQSTSLRSELASLRAQVASSPDQATTEKLNAAIESTSAALASTDSTFTQLNQQMQVSAQMVQNRKMMEEAAYEEAYKQVSDQQSQEDASRMNNAINNLKNTR